MLPRVTAKEVMGSVFDSTLKNSRPVATSTDVSTESYCTYIDFVGAMLTVSRCPSRLPAFRRQARAQVDQVGQERCCRGHSDVEKDKK